MLTCKCLIVYLSKKKKSPIVCYVDSPFFLFGRSILVHQSNGMKSQMQSPHFQATLHPSFEKGHIMSHWNLCSHYVKHHMAWLMSFRLKIAKVLFVRFIINFLCVLQLSLLQYSVIHIYLDICYLSFSWCIYCVCHSYVSSLSQRSICMSLRLKITEVLL